MAERFYKKAVTVDPKYKFGYYNLAHLYYLRHSYDEAIRNAESALAIDPNYDEAKKLLKTLQSHPRPRE